MNDEVVGGHTVFPVLGITIPPVKGSVVYWKNLKPSGEPEQTTFHSACPVRHGFKMGMLRYFFLF